MVVRFVGRIQRVAAMSNTWTPLVSMNMGIGNSTLPKRQTAVVFDTVGRPTVLSMQDAPGAGGLELFYAKCHCRGVLPLFFLGYMGVAGVGAYAASTGRSWKIPLIGSWTEQILSG